MEHIMVHGIMN